MATIFTYMMLQTGSLGLVSRAFNDFFLGWYQCFIMTFRTFGGLRIDVVVTKSLLFITGFAMPDIITYSVYFLLCHLPFSQRLFLILPGD